MLAFQMKAEDLLTEKYGSSFFAPCSRISTFTVLAENSFCFDFQFTKITYIFLLTIKSVVVNLFC